MSSGAGPFFLAVGKFFFVAVAASRLGLLARLAGLPVIIGFLTCGLLAGPEVLGLVTTADLKQLSFITSVALSYITLSAGAEMIIEHVRSLLRRIVLSTVLLTVFSILAGVGATAALAGTALLPWLEGYGTSCTITIGMVIGVIMVTGSPAAVIALIAELKAKGDFTNTVLGVTVLSDIVVLVVFAIASTSAESACKHENFNMVSFAMQMAMLIAAGVVGWVFGRLVILLLWFKRFPAIRYLILPAGYLVFLGLNSLTAWSHHNTAPYLISIEPLVVCIVAGFVASNASANRHRLLSTLANAGGIVFLPFFTLAGAGVSIKLLMASLGLALILFLVRAVAYFFGTGLGGFLSGQPRLHSMILWSTLITQAGVSLGLAAEIGDSFHDFGRQFQTSVISCVLVNSILGPVLFKVGMRRSGEVGKAGGDDEVDPDADVPTALIVTSSLPAVATSAAPAALRIPEEAMSLVLQTLQNKWAVTLLCGTQQEADAATAAVRAFALEASRAEQANKSVVKKAVETVVTKPALQVKRLYGHTIDKLSGINRDVFREHQVLIDEYKEATNDAKAADAGATVDLGTLNPAAEATTRGTRSGSVQIEMTALPSSTAAAPKSDSHAASGHSSAHGGGDAGGGHGHEDPHAWRMEEHFTAVCASSAASGAMAMAGADRAKFMRDLSFFFPSLAASAVAPPPGIAAGGNTSASGDLAPAECLIKHPSLSPVVEMVRRIKTLQAVSVVLPSLEATFAVSACVRVMLDGAPKKSHLHSVRVMSYLLPSSPSDDRQFWAKLLLSLSVVPIDQGAMVAAAASRLLTVAPTRPAVLLPAAPNNRSLAELVAKKMPPSGSSSSIHSVSKGLSLRHRKEASAAHEPGATSRSRGASEAGPGIGPTTSEHPCARAAIELSRMDGKARVAACAVAVASLSAGSAEAAAASAHEQGLTKKIIRGATGAVEKTTQHEEVPSWMRRSYVTELGAVQSAADGWDGNAELAALQGTAEAAKAAAAAADSNAGTGTIPRLQRAVGDLLKGNTITDESLGVQMSSRGVATNASDAAGGAGSSMWGGAGIGGGIGTSSVDAGTSFTSSIGIAMGSLGTYGSAAMATLAIESSTRRKKAEIERFRQQEEEAEEAAPSAWVETGGGGVAEYAEEPSDSGFAPSADGAALTESAPSTSFHQPSDADAPGAVSSNSGGDDQEWR